MNSQFDQSFHQFEIVQVEKEVSQKRYSSQRNRPETDFSSFSIAVVALLLRLLQNNAESSSMNYIQIEIIIEFKVLVYLFF